MPAAPPTCIFLHIPKAAGTTMLGMVRRQYPAKAVYPCYAHLPGAFDAFLALTPSERERIRCLAGHFPYGIHQFLPGTARYITVLRDPATRFLSKYAYLKQRPDLVALLSIDPQRLNTLEDFIDLQIERDTMNLQTRQICGAMPFDDFNPPYDHPLPDDALQVALNNLETHFDVVGQVEQLEASMLLMQRQCHWTHHVMFAQRNPSRRPAAHARPSAATLARIRDANPLDAALHAYAGQRLNEHMTTAGEAFTQALASLKRANRRFSMVVRIAQRSGLLRFRNAFRRT